MMVSFLIRPSKLRDVVDVVLTCFLKTNRLEFFSEEFVELDAT